MKTPSLGKSYRLTTQCNTEPDDVIWGNGEIAKGLATPMGKEAKELYPHGNTTVERKSLDLPKGMELYTRVDGVET